MGLVPCCPVHCSSLPHSAPSFQIPVTQACLMEDIEQWLSTDVGTDEESKGVTSEEFDKFLEERAKVADRLPNLSSPSAEGPPGPRPGNAPRKKTQEKNEDVLFAL